jgi:hypothetical protein
VGKRAAGAQLSRAGGQRTGFTSILGGARGLRITPSCTGLWPGGGRASKAGGGEDTGSSSSKSSSPYSSPMAAAACAGARPQSRRLLPARRTGEPAAGPIPPALYPLVLRENWCYRSRSVRTVKPADGRCARGRKSGAAPEAALPEHDSEGVSLQALRQSRVLFALPTHCPAARFRAMQSQLRI